MIYFVNNIVMGYYKMLQEVKIAPVKVESVENEVVRKPAEVYTHVSEVNIARIKNTLDTIFEEEEG